MLDYGISPEEKMWCEVWPDSITGMHDVCDTEKKKHVQQIKLHLEVQSVHKVRAILETMLSGTVCLLLKWYTSCA